MSSTRDIERAERNGRFRSQRRNSTSKDVNKDSDGSYWGFCLKSGVIGFVVGGIIATLYWINTPEQRSASQMRQSFETSGERRERRRRVRDGDLREDQTCVVCWTNAREIILLPCGHVCICEDCSVNINNNCPICRKQIIERRAAYIS